MVSRLPRVLCHWLITRLLECERKLEKPEEIHVRREHSWQTQAGALPVDGRPRPADERPPSAITHPVRIPLWLETAAGQVEGRSDCYLTFSVDVPTSRKLRKEEIPPFQNQNQNKTKDQSIAFPISSESSKWFGSCEKTPNLNCFHYFP